MYFVKALLQFLLQISILYHWFKIISAPTVIGCQGTQGDLFQKWFSYVQGHWRISGRVFVLKTASKVALRSYSEWPI
jgi:hypothetical protein